MHVTIVATVAVVETSSMVPFVSALCYNKWKGGGGGGLDAGESRRECFFVTESSGLFLNFLFTFLCVALC